MSFTWVHNEKERERDGQTDKGKTEREWRWWGGETEEVVVDEE